MPSCSPALITADLCILASLRLLYHALLPPTVHFKAPVPVRDLRPSDQRLPSNANAVPCSLILFHCTYSLLTPEEYNNIIVKHRLHYEVLPFFPALKLY